MIIICLQYVENDIYQDMEQMIHIKITACIQ